MGGAAAGLVGAVAALIAVIVAYRKLPSDTASASVEQAAKLLAERESLTDDLREDYARMRGELEQEREARSALEKLVTVQTAKLMDLGRTVRRLAKQVRDLGHEPDMGLPDD